MALEIATIPCLDDNYAFVAHDTATGATALIDAPEATPIMAFLDETGLPALDVTLQEGDRVEIGAVEGRVIDVSGHTLGHIALHFPDAKAAFTADSLMALGCGRVFEGTMPQMHESLQKLAALPEDTLIFSGHEYTAANGKFALTIDPGNPDLISRVQSVEAATREGEPTVPSTLAEELATNPFLRSDDPAIQAHLGMDGADPVDVFVEIRTRKNNF